MGESANLGAEPGREGVQTSRKRPAHHCAGLGSLAGTQEENRVRDLERQAGGLGDSHGWPQADSSGRKRQAQAGGA